MMRAGRPNKRSLLLSLLLGLMVNTVNVATGQRFVPPSIPQGQTIGDLGRAQFGSRPLPTNPSQSVIQDGTATEDFLTPGTAENPVVFGPVDGTVPTISTDSSWPQRPNYPNATTPQNLEELTDLTADAPSSVNAHRRPPQQESADIRPMRGREIVRQRYPDGQIQIARHVKQDRSGNYINDGQWQLFDRQGARIAMGTYVDGVMQGQWIRLHAKEDGGIFANPPFSLHQGPFRSEATFSDGKLAGQWLITDAKGSKVFEMPYKNGNRNGVARWFYPGEQIFRRMQFAANVPHGPLVQFDQRGKITRKENYQDGKRVENRITYYRPTKRKQESKIILRGRVELNGNDQWWEAQPAELVITGEDVDHGPIRSWYKNGQPKMTGTLDQGVRKGRFIWWYENGTKQSTGVYDQSGQKTGQWIWWHDTGMKSTVGRYDSDQPEGIWRQWNKNGQQVREKDFDADIDLENSALENAPQETDPHSDGLDSRGDLTSDSDSVQDDLQKNSANDQPQPAGSSQHGTLDAMRYRTDPPPAEGTNAPSSTETLEEIPPVEFEGEEFPTPKSSANENHSTGNVEKPISSEQSKRNKFFQTGY